MKLITEYVEQNIETICEQKKDGSKDYFIEGVFMQSNKKNRNGRIYEKASIEKAVKNTSLNKLKKEELLES
jgi:hypothetical protein